MSDRKPTVPGPPDAENEASTRVARRQSVVETREATLAEREDTVATREDTVAAREDTAGGREATAGGREVTVGDREAVVRHRETTVGDREMAIRTEQTALSRAEEERDRSLAQMRASNEQLLLALLRVQELADEAEAARVERHATEVRETALRAADRLKDEFLAMLGHELRNPLAPIVTALEVMNMRGTTETVRERAIIDRQVRHMVRLIDDLMDMTRITQGRLMLRRTPLEIATVVDNALEIASPLFERRGHVLTVSVPRTGLRVEGDEARLAQVVANLLTNAAKYTPPGGAVTVTGSREGGWVTLSVKDTGAGISPELLPTIFDRFVQGPQTADRARGGLGLGLSIVKSLVALHDGDVTVRSGGIDQGAEFIVRLPALEAAAVVDPAAAPRETAPGARPMRRVLVVDDNVDAAEMLADALVARDHVVAIAHDGPEALRALAAFHPEAVVLDIGLPVMDGYEVARRMRAGEASTGEHIRLIALTGYGQEGDRQKSLSAGMDFHLVKPVDLRSLEQALSADGP